MAVPAAAVVTQRTKKPQSGERLGLRAKMKQQPKARKFGVVSWLYELELSVAESVRRLPSVFLSPRTNWSRQLQNPIAAAVAVAGDEYQDLSFL